MTDFDSIGAELRAHFAADERLLGSKLGGWFKQNHPEINLADAGGLKAFLSLNFSSVLTCVGKDEISRVDDRYVLSGANNFAPPHSLSLPQHLPQSSSAVDIRIWDAFVNPTSAFKNKLSIDGGRLVIDNAAQGTRESRVALPTVTSAEERAIYEQFTEIESSKAKPELTRALRSANYQKEWYEEIRTSDISDLGQRWGRYRYNELLKLFEARLDQIGLVSHVKDILKEQLLNCFQARRAARKGGAEMRTATASEPKSSVDATSQVRLDTEAFALAAIQHMSEAELMQLSIPLHAVLKVLKAAQR
jgi:hypothetical protein